MRVIYLHSIVMHSLLSLHEAPAGLSETPLQKGVIRFCLSAGCGWCREAQCTWNRVAANCQEHQQQSAGGAFWCSGQSLSIFKGFKSSLISDIALLKYDCFYPSPKGIVIKNHHFSDSGRGGSYWLNYFPE